MYVAPFSTCSTIFLSFALTSAWERKRDFLSLSSSPIRFVNATLARVQTRRRDFRIEEGHTKIYFNEMYTLKVTSGRTLESFGTARSKSPSDNILGKNIMILKRTRLKRVRQNYPGGSDPTRPHITTSSYSCVHPSSISQRGKERKRESEKTSVWGYFLSLFFVKI